MVTLRQDRFFESMPAVTQHDFYETYFLKYYNQVERYPVKKTVINSIRSLHHNSLESLELITAIKNAPDEHDVITTYSSSIAYGSQPFYAYVNDQLCKDDEQIISKLMPLIRRATSQINYKPPSKDCVVYRGMTLSNSQKSYFTSDTVFRFPGFTSTSKCKDTASEFGNTLFKIYIPARCQQVRSIDKISWCPGEQEYLFSPYSLFQVLQITKEFIALKAIDNLSKIGMNIPQSYEQSKLFKPLPNYNKEISQKKKKDTVYLNSSLKK